MEPRVEQGGKWVEKLQRPQTISTQWSSVEEIFTVWNSVERCVEKGPKWYAVWNSVEQCGNRESFHTVEQCGHCVEAGPLELITGFPHGLSTQLPHSGHIRPHSFHTGSDCVHTCSTRPCKSLFFSTQLPVLSTLIPHYHVSHHYVPHSYPFRPHMFHTFPILSTHVPHLHANV